MKGYLMPHITATVGTKGRYGTTLPLTLSAISSQTRPPDELWIMDDNPPPERVDMMQHPVIAPILAMMSRDVKIMVVEGFRKGPQHNHEQARRQARELVWRVDDDEAPEPEVLQCLEGHLVRNPKLGAAAGLVLSPPAGKNEHASSAAEDVLDCRNAQWYEWPTGTVFEDVGHLHSTYLYRKHAAQYRTDLSPVGHCEETFHTLAMHLNRWNLMIDANVTTWHYRQPNGGIRSVSGDYAADFMLFTDWCRTLPIKFRRWCNVVAMAGQGDVFACAEAAPKIIDFQRTRGNRVRFICRPVDVPLFTSFSADDVKVIPGDQAGAWELRHDGGIYGWMARDNWKGGLSAAFLHYYTETYPLWLGY